MAYKQIRSFNLSNMGTKKGWCLQNVRLGFGISRGTFPSAVADMNVQKKNGTFHFGLAELPKNCAVPVYCDTASKYEHVIVSVNGKDFYEDGYKVNINNYAVFGWGECCDGERVVEYYHEKKSVEEVAKEVWQGKWGNGENRKKALEEAGYDYNEVQAVVNKTDNTVRTYTVCAGDTLSEIGLKFGVPYQKIAKDNGIANPNLIHVGDVLKIKK